MSNNVVAFIRDNFKLLQVLKDSEASRIELVLGADNYPYIRRLLKNCSAPYKELTKVECSNLAKVLFVATEEEWTYVIEEQVQGRTLQELLDSRGAFSEAQVRTFALQLSQALKALHQQGIIHRDIKPANILLQDNGQIKLIDFDAARLKHQDKQHDTKILGTEGYAPPEQYGFQTTDERSDWYALGKTLEELLGPNYKGSLSPVINKCIRFDPQDRVASAEEFRQLLEGKRANKYLVAGIVFMVCVAGFFGWNYILNNSEKEVASPKEASQAVQQASPQAISKPSDNKKDSSNAKLQDKMPVVDLYMQTEAVTLYTINKAQNLPRELRLPNNGAMQGIRLLHKQKPLTSSRLEISCQDLYIIPDKSPSIPYLGDYGRWLSFTYEGGKAVAATVQVDHFITPKKKQQPNAVFVPFWGNERFKYIQTGPKPCFKVKLVYPDGYVKEGEIPVIIK